MNNNVSLGQQQGLFPVKATRNVPSYKAIAEELSGDIIELRETITYMRAQGSMNQYQDWAWGTQLPSSTNTEYLGLGLAAEAGEVAGVLAKLRRDGGSLDRANLTKELGDTLWFVASIGKYFDITLAEIADANRAKIESRKARGVLGGSGDNR